MTEARAIELDRDQRVVREAYPGDLELGSGLPATGVAARTGLSGAPGLGAADTDTAGSAQAIRMRSTARLNMEVSRPFVTSAYLSEMCGRSPPQYSG